MVVLEVEGTGNIVVKRNNESQFYAEVFLKKHTDSKTKTPIFASQKFVVDFLQ
jgi:hypothetical protein